MRISYAARKELDKRLSEWLFKWLLKPVVIVAPYLRTNYWLNNRTLTVKGPFCSPTSMRIDEFDEIGVETTDQGPFVEDVFLILKRGEMRLRIGDPHPVFRMLMDRFESLDGFDWQPFLEAMSCTDNRYFLCWRRPHVSS